MQAVCRGKARVWGAFLLALAFVCAPPALQASELSITSPGWSWGRAYYPEDFERQRKHHVVYNLISDQALRFSKPHWPLVPEVFVRLDTKRDSIGSSYDNRFTGALGARVTAQPAKGLKLHLGGRYERESRFNGSAVGGGLVGFVGWSGWWRVYDEPAPFKRLDVSTWGEARTSYAQLGGERTNGFLEATTQADVLLLIPHDKLEFLARGDVQVNLDTKGFAHRNFVQPSVALVVRLQAPKNYQLEAGVRAASRHWLDGGSAGGLSGFVQFSRSWETLKKPRFTKQSSARNP